jgi:heme/copper-type cytochrome/quinol oxidase subunit 3
VAEQHHTTTGLDNRKLLMWLFLASDCLFFGALIATYLVYEGRSLVGPYPRDVFSIPLTSYSAFVLLMSSVTMALAVGAVHRGNLRLVKVFLFLTVLMGMNFIANQIYEFNHFRLEGLTPKTNVFGSTFFTLTGFHGAHVTIGIIWLASLLVYAMKGKMTPKSAINVEIAGLYWHFVDLVWVVIFTVVYLIGTLPE